MRKIGSVMLALGLVSVVIAVAAFHRGRNCSKTIPEEKTELYQLDPKTRMAAVTKKLDAVVSKSAAERLVKNAMKQGGETVHQQWEATKGQHAGQAPTRELPSSFISNGQKDPEFQMQDKKSGDAQVRELPNSFIDGQAGTNAGTAQCIFDVMQAFTSVIGLGDDINAIVRTCPEPRDTPSEIACEVNGAVLVTWVGNIAARLSLAASDCAKSANIDAVCSAGVTGLVAVLGEVAAGASLAAPTCTTEAQQSGGASLKLPTSKISELGDQTLNGKYTGRLLSTPHEASSEEGRRLLIGQGAVGNGIQCSVDVAMVAENAADIGLSINQAVNNKFDYCKKGVKQDSLTRSLCAVDVGGAIAYLSQVITFISLAILHCKDFLDVKALCSASVAAIVTGAAGIAPFGAAINAGCAKNKEAKAAVASLNIPGGRRLAEISDLKMPLKPGKPDSIARMNEVMQDLRATMTKLGHNVSAIPKHQTTDPEDLKNLLSLMEPPLYEKASFRGSGLFEEDCQ